MRTLAARWFVALTVLGCGAALGQSPRIRQRVPPPNTQVVPATTAPVPGYTQYPAPADTQVVPVTKTPVTDYTLKPPPTATPVVPYQSLDPAGDRERAARYQWRRSPHPEISAVWQPLNEQLEVFAIDAKGTLKDVWKAQNGYWEASLSLSAPGLALPGAPLAAVWQPLNEKLAVFTIGTNGALEETSKVHNGRWAAPVYVTRPNYAPPGAHVAAVFQPLNNQLEVFTIDATGAVRLVWRAQDGGWQGPVSLTAPGTALPGAPITAVWQPLNEQLEVFFVDATGAVREVKKQHNSHWLPPEYLTTQGLAGPRARLAAVWQPLNEQLEVFVVDRRGVVQDVWKAHNSPWNAPAALTRPGYAVSGAAIVAMWEPRFEVLRFVTISPAGDVVFQYKRRNNPWAWGVAGRWADPQATGAVASAAVLSAVVEPVRDNIVPTVFTIDEDQAVRFMTDGSGFGVPPAITQANLGPIYGAHAAACSRKLRNWSNGDGLVSDDELTSCINFMGIADHCARLDMHVGVGYPPQADSPRYLQCDTNSAPAEDALRQTIHIFVGTAQGLGEAAVAMVVYAPEIAQGYACMDGVIFACATLAIDLGARADLVPAEIHDAVDLAVEASSCVDGDPLACIKLGKAGARAAGIEIPGDGLGQTALLAQQCTDGDYGACLRLGEKAAMAAGVPVGQINQAAQNAQDCFAGNVDACIALGRQAAKAGIPVGGAVDGVQSVRLCSAGSLLDCRLLGEKVASLPR